MNHPTRQTIRLIRPGGDRPWPWVSGLPEDVHRVRSLRRSRRPKSCVSPLSTGLLVGNPTVARTPPGPLSAPRQAAVGRKSPLCPASRSRKVVAPPGARLRAVVTLWSKHLRVRKRIGFSAEAGERDWIYTWVVPKREGGSQRSPSRSRCGGLLPVGLIPVRCVLPWSLGIAALDAALDADFEAEPMRVPLSMSTCRFPAGGQSVSRGLPWPRLPALGRGAGDYFRGFRSPASSGLRWCFGGTRAVLIRTCVDWFGNCTRNTETKQERETGSRTGSAESFPRAIANCRGR